MDLSSTEFNEKLFSRRGFLIGTAMAVGSTLLVGCGSQSTTSNSRVGSTAKHYTLAFVQGLKDDSFYVTMQKGAQAMADKLGATLVVDGPTQFDAALQTPIVEALIVKRVDAIIIAACDKQAMIAPLQRANYAGIKIVSVDTYIGDGDYVNGPVKFPLSYISSDNVQGGRIVGGALIKAMGNKGSIYIQNTKPGVITTDQREMGCKDAIKATNGAVTLVGVDYNNNNSANAAQQTAAALQRNKNLTGIFATNLFGAEGVAQTLKNTKKQGIIKVASFDATEQAITDLKKGVVDLVIAQKPADMGSIAVQYAVDALNGKTNTSKKRVLTGYVIINVTNVDTPEAQAAIYRSN